MIDLHTHSTVSDGSDSPTRVVDLAADAGCSAVALTDHDRLDGLAEAGARAEQRGVRLVPGCELSCEGGPGTFHLLVYFVDPSEGPLQDELVRLQRIRADRNARLVEVLRSQGIDITLGEVEAEAGGEGVGRPHFAGVLVAKGWAESVQDAFDRFLGKGQPGYVEKERLTAERAMSLAAASGGVPVIAHPLSLGFEGAALENRLRELAAIGLQGVEAVYGRYDPEQRAGLAAMAERVGLCVTGGSDHHGTYKPDLTVGTGRGDLDVPDRLLDLLEARRP
jgi:predicted metal-dependent phosphoesterase TrpH